MFSFDYATESFGNRMPLPYQFPRCSYETVALSVVREEKLSVLLQLRGTSRKEIWVTNKINETTQVLSWSKVLTLDNSDFGYCPGLSFFVDEEKKQVLCFEKCRVFHIHTNDEVFENKVYTVGEDNKVTQLRFEQSFCPKMDPYVFGYVPSLVQIEQPRRKRKRGD